MENKLLLQDLTDAIAAKEGMTKKAAEAFVRALFETIEEGLLTDKFVKIKGLGTFKIISVGERESVNINTGERFSIEGHERISFTPDTLIKDLVNRPFAHFQTVIINDDTNMEELESVDDEFPEETAAEDLETASDYEQEETDDSNSVAPSAVAEETHSAETVAETNPATEKAVSTTGEKEVEASAYEADTENQTSAEEPEDSEEQPTAEEDLQDEEALTAPEQIAEEKKSSLEENPEEEIQEEESPADDHLDAGFPNEEKSETENNIAQEINTIETPVEKELELHAEDELTPDENGEEAQTDHDGKAFAKTEEEKDSSATSLPKEEAVQTEEKPVTPEASITNGASRENDSALRMEDAEDDACAAEAEVQEQEQTEKEQIRYIIKELDNKRNIWKNIAIALLAILLLILSYFAGYFRWFCPCELMQQLSPALAMPDGTPPEPAPEGSCTTLTDSSSIEVEINVNSQDSTALKSGTAREAANGTCEENKDKVRKTNPEATPKRQEVTPQTKTVSTQLPPAIQEKKNTTSTTVNPYRQVEGGKYKIVGTQGTHKIESGETIRTIALDVYGSKGYALYIITHNNLSDPDNVEVGTVLKLPKLERQHK